MRRPHSESIILVAAAVFLGAAACSPPVIVSAPTPEPMVLPAVDATEYAPFRQSGQGMITGQAFLTTRGGDVKVAAGRQVTLDPATAYSRAWYEEYGRVSDQMPPAPEFAAARRTTVADAEGRFRFSNLPSGSYIVRTSVTWETGSGSAGLQGGIVSDVVAVTGDTREVILNQTYSPPGPPVREIALLTKEQLVGRQFRPIRKVTGVSCSMRGFEPISEDEARANLVEEARKISADAVTNVVCKRGGLTLRYNCMAHFICEGDAIGWV